MRVQGCSPLSAAVIVILFSSFMSVQASKLRMAYTKDVKKRTSDGTVTRFVLRPKVSSTL